MQANKKEEEMNIFYNPTYAEPIYANLAKNKVFLNTQFVNTKGLVEILELHEGIFQNKKNDDERFAAYFSAMKNFMEKGENDLSKSFEADSYNTAKECLSWRDSLSAAGWNANTKSSSERMKVLSEIEKRFDSENFPNIHERISTIIKAINSGSFLPEMEITTLCDWKIFKPIEAELLSSLEKRGVKISNLEQENKKENNISKILNLLNGEKNVHLNSHEKDSSFEIWSFKTSDEALEYLSLLKPNDFDVWINAENHEFDSWHNLEGKAASGFKTFGTTQNAELLKIALSLFEMPLNIYNLIEWLNAPLNPLPLGFRKMLANKIVKNGGFYNEEYEDAIENYKNKIEDSKDKEKFEDKINKFLPSTKNLSTEKEDIPLENVKTFVKNLENWARFKSLNERAEINLDELNSILSQCKFVLLLLENQKKAALPYEEIESLINFLDSYKIQIPQNAEVGSKFVVSSPESFASNARKTIWCDFYKFVPDTHLFYSFLTSAEKEEFSKTLNLWNEENEREFIKMQNLVPFMFTTEKLVLVSIENAKKNQKKNPMLIQIEKTFEKEMPNQSACETANQTYSELNKNGITIKKELSELTSTISSSQVRAIDNRIEKDAKFVEITKTDYIKKNWSDHQSQSSLEKLINLPVDYVVENFVRFKSDSLSDFGQISRTKGNVAHKIIQKLFSPSEENKNGNPDFIEKKIKSDFEEVFSETVLEEGAILLVNKNKGELDTFKKNVRKCIEVLCDTIKECKLHVSSCEKEIHGKIGNIDIKGFADMVLEDKNGNPYIFDFKWTSSKDKHENFLKENKSVQFALYKKLVEDESGKKVKACAYFLMPKGEFVTLDKLDGKNIHKTYVQKDRQESDLLKEIQNSYIYRKAEIENGKLEETTGFKKDEMYEISEYEKETESKMLVPLDYYKNERPQGFTKIKEIKGRKE